VSDTRNAPRCFAARCRQAAAQLPLLPRAVGLVWQAAPLHTAVWAAMLLLQGLLPVAAVHLTRLVVDGLVAIQRNAQTPPSHSGPLWSAALLAGVLLASEALTALAQWIRAALGERVQDHVMLRIHRKSAEVDLAFYESADFYDRLHRARSDAMFRPLALLQSTGGLAQGAVTLVAMLAVLMPYGPLMPLALLAAAAPALVLVPGAVLRRYRWRVASTADERRAWYYDTMATSGHSAADVRLLDLGGHFADAYQSLRRALRRGSVGLARREAIAEAAAGAWSLAVMAAALAWMITRAFHGLVSLGDLTLLYQALTQGQRLTRTLLENFGQILGHCLFLSGLFEFLSLRPRILDGRVPRPGIVPLRRGIRMSNLRFTYPAAQSPALDGFDLFLPAGSIVALVGANGAGKSTLIKLLCRLYDPDSGIIELDGRDIRDLPLADLRRHITVLFQQPVRYTDTVERNIAIGCPRGAADASRLRASASAAGCDTFVSALPQGYQTLLGKEYADGVELSVGQWQRLALARALNRPAPVILLDEPTSALDAAAEADWMDRFRRFADDRTALVITHRLTTARRADLVCVMAAGRIVESGTHEQLAAGDGWYARCWNASLGAAAAASPDYQAGGPVLVA